MVVYKNTFNKKYIFYEMFFSLIFTCICASVGYLIYKKLGILYGVGVGLIISGITEKNVMKEYKHIKFNRLW